MKKYVENMKEYEENKENEKYQENMKEYVKNMKECEENVKEYEEIYRLWDVNKFWASSSFVYSVLRSTERSEVQGATLLTISSLQVQSSPCRLMAVEVRGKFWESSHVFNVGLRWVKLGASRGASRRK